MKPLGNRLARTVAMSMMRKVRVELVARSASGSRFKASLWLTNGGPVEPDQVVLLVAQGDTPATAAVTLYSMLLTWYDNPTGIVETEDAWVVTGAADVNPLFCH